MSNFWPPLIALILAAPALQADTLRVCPTCALQTPSQAAPIAKDGDTVEIEAGEYFGDAAVWRAHNLLLRGVNGKAHLYSRGVMARNKAIWLIQGNNTVVENIGFHDARVRDRNGAGIRLEGTNLVVRNCLFRHNENGLLTGVNPDSEVFIENSEFDENGHGDGKSHNAYIGKIKMLTVTDSYLHQALIGHQLKSRALENRISGNRFEDGPNGRSSYLIDLPNGGVATIEGNTLLQGPMAENSTMVSFGAEKAAHPTHRLVVRNNLFKNERLDKCILLDVRKPLAEPAEVEGNRFSGCSRMKGPIRAANNQTLD
ncbi:MAG: right-handed parallel beta-helix repeat-containing protein [Pseudomonadota bacterium]